MIVTTRFPDLPPDPETAANAAFRRRFLSRWGRENSVFLASTRRAAYGPLATALSFKTVLEGAVTLTLGRRQLRMEPGCFLPVNDGGSYRVDINAEQPVRCLSVHFKPELAAEVAAVQGVAWTGALDGRTTRRQPLLRETLRPHEPALQPLLQRIALRARSPDADTAALEEDFIDLLSELLRLESRTGTQVLAALPAVRPATRAELVRRVAWAADFIRSSYREAITLDDIAAAAHLSKFHLLRAFAQVQGCTPHQFVQSLRVAAAQHLLANPALDLQQVAEASGFGSRWTLQRALRRHCGASGRWLRTGVSARPGAPS